MPIPLLRFRNKPGEASVKGNLDEVEKQAQEHVAKAMEAARRCVASPDFQEMRAELTAASACTMDLLIGIDEAEPDPVRFSSRARLLIHKVKFLRDIQIITQTKAGLK